MSREQDANGALQHFGYDGAGVSTDGFNTLGIEGRLLLAGTLVHEAHIPFFGGQNTGMINLHKFGNSNPIIRQHESRKDTFFFPT